MPKRPNILLITCHDLGRHLGCYGVQTVHSPNVDRIGAEGVRFARSFCTSPGCSPSRAALATGRFPHCNGVLGLAHAHFGWGLAADERHLALLLRQAGYYAVLFGLQHVTYHPETMGFHEIHPERASDAVAENFATLLNQRAGSRDPLYLEVNFFEPHRPFDYGGATPDVERGVYVPGYLPDSSECRSELGAMQGAIRKMDGAVRRLLESLASAQLLDETLVVFTADHGIAFPRAKGTLYDGGIETALLMRHPSLLPGGSVLSPLISNVDVAPTLLEAAGAPIPANVQGKSFWPLLRGEPYQERAEVFAEKTFHNEYDPLRCVRTDRFKLIARFEASNRVEVPADIMRGPTYHQMIPDLLEPEGKRFELYDLMADPWEQANLAGRAETAEVEMELKRRLHTWMRDTADPLLKGPVASPFYHATLQQLQQESVP